MSLPIHNHAQAIVDAVHNHRVVIVEGPAGTGKTTQLPRLLADANLVPRCIGITQPRRIAAINVAHRIAEEVQCPIGSRVGYAIRFDDMTCPNTQIKVMTDGILLQEARHDPHLQAYDIIMVDEAHERSLNIDFVLGLLHQILRQSDHLRVIISSATLHPGHFQAFFGDITGHVPCISIASRTYPIDISYAPPPSRSPDAMVTCISSHIVRLHRCKPPGDILVFLPGEGMIVRLALALKEHMGTSMVVLSLYGRLTRAEQERVFLNFPQQRKVILSTNLAETSVTIPGVCYVIDSGVAKLPWFQPKTNVTTLREEPISQASATQRAGRAGRTSPGEVIRLYTEEMLEDAEAYTPEEITRVDLSEAMLRLIDLGIHDVENFPFPTPPPNHKLRAALQSLEAMGAIDAQRKLTHIGRLMAVFPLSPPLARMVVEATMHFADVVNDVLAIGAYLSVRSPFLYPAGQEDAARKAQRKFADPLGDPVMALQAYQQYLGASNPEDYCHKNFLDTDTMAFIKKSHDQLCDIAATHGAIINAHFGKKEHVARCIATGFADKVMIKRGYSYETLTGLSVAIHPSSTLFHADTALVVAAEIVSSGRIYAFNVTALHPSWLVQIHPEAAKIWRLDKKSSAPRGPRAAAAVEPVAPTTLLLGKISLQLSPRRHKPMVDIPFEAIAHLQHVEVPAFAKKFRARVHGPHGILLRGRLLEVLAILPYMPLPSSNQSIPQGLQLGQLFDVERNFHSIDRNVQHLLQHMTKHATKSGWLMLACNQDGGFWYDIGNHFLEALETTLAALYALCDHATMGAAYQSCVDTRIKQFETWLHDIDHAMQRLV